MSDNNNSDKLDRRDFFASAAGLAAAVAGISSAQAGGHMAKPAELSAEDKLPQPVGQGAVITGDRRQPGSGA